MSKKENALGSIPTFENVAKTTQDLDLFLEEPIETAKEKEEKERKVKEDLKKQLLAEAQKKREETKRKELTITATEGKEIIKQLEEAKEPSNDEPMKSNKSSEKPSTKKGVRTGYKRQTFVIREDLLEMMQALSSYNDIMQVDLLEAFIVKGLAEIDEEKKSKALASYRAEQKKGKDAKEEEAKRNVAKLFN